MKLLVPSTVLLLMVSVGMSLNWTQFVANWRRLTLATWGKLLVATFIIPPILALALGSLLPLDRGTLIGLFLIAVAPGGNALLMVTLIVLLVKMRPALTEVSPWLIIAVLLLAVGCIAASFAIVTGGTVITKTLVVCNVNRHVGLALLLSGAYFRNQKALPAIAAYALAAQFMIWLYAKLARYRPTAT